jgi:hypothetical protein
MPCKTKKEREMEGTTETTATPERVWLTYPETEAYTNYHATTIWRAVKRGELRQGGLPRSPRFHRDDLDAWMRGDKAAEQPPESAVVGATERRES